MQTFVDAEDAYLAWIRARADGYVLNAGRTEAPSMPVVLHQATCPFISGAYTNYTTRDYIKICSSDRAQLERWSEARRSASDFRPCVHCLD